MWSTPTFTRKPESGPCPKQNESCQKVSQVSPISQVSQISFCGASWMASPTPAWTRVVTRALVHTYRVRRKNSQTARLEADELSWGVNGRLGSTEIRCPHGKWIAKSFACC